jgi:hypothetical protein
MQALIQPPAGLNIELKSSEVDVTEDQFRQLTFYMDGRPLPKATNDNRLEIAARWNGNRLVSDEKSPLGGKMSRTFELSPDGLKLYENLQIDSGRARTPIDIRYVYDAVNPGTQSDRESSDPDRPILKKNTDSGSSSNIF